MIGAARIGLVGGTFDPIHLGHIEMSLAARECAGLDRVILVPSAVPPHRAGVVAAAADRLAMCRLAAAGRPALEVSDAELRRSGPSYTLDTLRELAAGNPGARLHLVLGWDAAREIGSWREPEAVLALARLVVVPRPGLEAPAPEALRAAGIDPARTLVCAAATAAIRATEVRACAAAGGPLAALVDQSVADYIHAHRLYGAERA